MFFDPCPCKLNGEGSSIHRDLDLAQQKREGADVILMTVCQNHTGQV